MFVCVYVIYIYIYISIYIYALTFFFARYPIAVLQKGVNSPLSPYATNRKKSKNFDRALCNPSGSWHLSSDSNERGNVLNPLYKLISSVIWWGQQYDFMIISPLCRLFPYNLERYNDKSKVIQLVSDRTKILNSGSPTLGSHACFLPNACVICVQIFHMWQNFTVISLKNGDR